MLGREDGEATIIHRSIAPDPTSAEYDFLEIVADLEGCSIEALPSFYEQLDHFVGSLFDDPPAPEAQMELKFSYAGYRVTLDQNGQVTLVRVKESVE